MNGTMVAVFYSRFEVGTVVSSAQFRTYTYGDTMSLTAKFKFGQIVLVFTVVGTLFFAAPPPASAASVTINSSSAVTYLDSGLTSADFPSAFTGADFLAAQTGTTASVLTSTPFYVSSLASGPGAVWIGTNTTAGAGSGDTALYAVSFNLPGTVSSASFNLYYAVDNGLGSSSNPGIYVNGTALPNSSAIPCSACGLSFNQENNYTDANIGPLLVSGTNWIYFDAVNVGQEAGLIFSATITTDSGATPEPLSVLLLGIGLLGLLALATRSRRLAHSSARH